MLDPPHSAWPRGQALRLEGVKVHRGGSEILRGINLSFEPGRRHVILGASGSGKSTLIRLLNRLDDPDSGEIRVGEVSIRSLPVLDVRRSVGLVFQSPRPLPGSLGDNLVYPFEVRKAPRPDRSKQLASLAEVGLDPAWLDRDASQLSGGERQRLAIAAALGLDPEILVLDEPTSALDPISSRQVADLLDRRSRADGLRTIIVTHDRAQASRMGGWGIRVEAGTIGDEGPILDVLGRADGAELDE